MREVMHTDTTLEERTYSTPEAAAIAGLSYRQADYWVRKGLIAGLSGTGSGIPRRWSQAQVDRLCELSRRYNEALALLAELGFNPNGTRKSEVAA